ncbi:MAG: NAD(P)-binding protein [Hyphomonadaceae bacterium JAD_PAG50586_4]|nr:MAG: NAD(P)-binding protein [Hyphomonadaceae bacterium JAD_PAG50586_4]
MDRNVEKDPKIVLDTFSLGCAPIFVIGSFTKGVTVYSQQVRALNLIWSLVEAGGVADGGSKRIAIVGGGFAGLTAAAALLKKLPDAQITIFEKFDTLLPLQHGCDARWLHPKIYDWPAEGSEASVAMLPLLNWRAARASDVTAEVMGEWQALMGAEAKESEKAKRAERVKVFCNTRHLQIETQRTEEKVLLEWIGEPRHSDGGSREEPSHGGKGRFDYVLLAAGFGIERATPSYWRNDEFAQASLSARQSYIVSGAGDGGVIDLLRLQISQFRQDRILNELFDDVTALLDAFKKAQADKVEDLFVEFERIADAHPKEFKAVLEKLRRRIRRDTEVIFKYRTERLSDLIGKDARLSFQNRVLFFLLYQCGAFTPSRKKLRHLADHYFVGPTHIIRRHGVRPEEALSAVLSKDLMEAVEKSRDALEKQTSQIQWRGGYFAFAGKLGAAKQKPDGEKAKWRKEYLPGPTALMARSFCSTVASILEKRNQSDRRLRVTLHRALIVGEEEFLQQTCRYAGFNLKGGDQDGAGRTFSKEHASIGLAYRSRKIVRSHENVPNEVLAAAMAELNLEEEARQMDDRVGFVLAIPFLEPLTEFTAPNPVSAVLYIDTTSQMHLSDEEVREIVKICNNWLADIVNSSKDLDRVYNLRLSAIGRNAPPPAEVSYAITRAFELMDGVLPPETKKPFQLNYDYNDFRPVGGPS